MKILQHSIQNSRLKRCLTSLTLMATLKQNKTLVNKRIRKTLLNMLANSGICCLRIRTFLKSFAGNVVDELAQPSTSSLVFTIAVFVENWGGLYERCFQTAARMHKKQ